MRRVVTALVVAVLCLVGLAPLARAAVVADGPLEPGVPTALTFGPGDVAAFTVTTPAATTQTLTATGMSPGLVLRLIYTGGTSGPVTIDGSDPSTWFVELGSNGGDTTDQFLQVDVASPTGGDVTLTLTNAPVLDVRVPVGTDVPVTVSVPGQDVRLVFDAGVQDTATLSLTSVALGDALNGSTAPRFTVTGPDFPFAGDVVPENASGGYGPGTVQRDGDSSWFVDLAGGRTGTFTVHVDLQYAAGPDLFFRFDAQPLTLDTPARVRQAHFSALGVDPIGVEVFPSGLVGAGGGPGSVQVQLVLPGAAPVTLGSVSGTPVTLATPDPIPAFTDVTLRVVGDGATTGTVFLRLVLAPAPDGTLTPGVPSTLVLPAGAGTRAWSFEAGADETYEMPLRDIAFGDPTNLGSVTVQVLDPFGQRLGSTVLTTFSTQDRLAVTTRTAGRYTVELSWEAAVVDFDVTTSVVLVKRTVRTVTATAPADVPVDLSTPGEALAVELPVRAGHRLAVRLVDQAWTGPTDQFGNPPSASLTASSDVLPFEPFSTDDFGTADNGDLYRQTLDAPVDGTVTVTVSVDALTTGTARLLVTEPVDTTGTFAPSGTTTIPVTEPGSVADYTFEVTGSGPAALDIAPPVLSSGNGATGSVRFTLVAPDGTQQGTNTIRADGDRFWLDLSTRGASGLPETATGTWHLRVDPSADATGSLAVDRVAGKVTTTAVRPGRTTTVTYAPGDVRRLTFAGRAGQRPVLRVAGDPVAVALVLVGPDGRAVRTFESFEYGGGYAEFEPLPASGTWSVVLDPDGAQAGTQTVRLDLVRDPVVTVEPGRLVTATWAAGQNPVYRFTVRKGQHVAVDVRTARFDGDPFSDQASLALFDPAGGFTLAQTTLGSPFVGATQPPVWLEPSPSGFTASADGVWSVRIDPFRATTGRITFVVRTAADQVVPRRLGKVTTVRVDRPVQDVALPFDVGPADAGKLLTWQVTGSTFSQARLTLLTPFGTLWETTTIGPGDSTGTFFSGVGFTGTWTLVVDPVDGATGRASVLFTLGPPA